MLMELGGPKLHIKAHVSKDAVISQVTGLLLPDLGRHWKERGSSSRRWYLPERLPALRPLPGWGEVVVVLLAPPGGDMEPGEEQETSVAAKVVLRAVLSRRMQLFSAIATLASRPTTPGADILLHTQLHHGLRSSNKHHDSLQSQYIVSAARPHAAARAAPTCGRVQRQQGALRPRDGANDADAGRRLGLCGRLLLLSLLLLGLHRGAQRLQRHHHGGRVRGALHHGGHRLALLLQGAHLQQAPGGGVSSWQGARQADAPPAVGLLPGLMPVTRGTPTAGGSWRMDRHRPTLVWLPTEGQVGYIIFSCFFSTAFPSFP